MTTTDFTPPTGETAIVRFPAHLTPDDLREPAPVPPASAPPVDHSGPWVRDAVPTRAPHALRRGAERADRALLRLPALHLPAAFDSRSRHSTLWLWITTRLCMLLVVGFGQESVVGDVTYYGRSLHSMFTGVPLRETLQEYPLPVFGVLLPQFLVGGLNPLAFALLFLLSMLGVDAWFTRLLVRARRDQQPDRPAGAGGAVGFWLWFVPLMGPLAYFRFDLVPAVLAGAAVLAAVARPRTSGILTAVGAGLKLWPAALLPTFLMRRAGRRAALTGFVVTGVIVLGASIAIGGLTRLVSPLRWQSERGLQIESVFALPLMIGRAAHHHGVWNVHVSKYKAWEIFGAGSHLLVTLSTVGTVGAVGMLAWFWWRAFRLPVASLELVGWLVFTTVAVMTVVNKTLSPQYLLWLGGPLAAMLIRPGRERALRRVTVGMLVVAGLTQLIFPLTYNWLLGSSWLMEVSTLLLVVRNVVLVWLTWVACRQVWAMTRRAPAGEATAAMTDGSVDDVTARTVAAQSFSSTA